MNISRRALLAGAAYLTSTSVLSARSAAIGKSAHNALAALEEQTGGRLGIAAIDTGTGNRVLYRADERFAMCSTFKFLASAAVLARVDRDEEDLGRRIAYGKADLVDWSPVTKNHAGGPGLTLAEICEAAVTQSDNTAGNLLIESLGGPAGVTAYARSLGDRMTRLDRYETALNDVRPGDERDTTTPAAMLGNLQKVVLDDALSASSQKRITDWLVGNKTGDRRLRAGLPSGWRVGDKTGTNRTGAMDIAVAWPPGGRAPLAVSAYLVETNMSVAERDAVFEKIGAMVAEWF